MSSSTAVVRGGRIVVDQPTDLPEGAVVEVTIQTDGLDTVEREALHASLDRALDDAEAGRGEDAWVYLQRVRDGRASRTAR